MHDPAIKQGDRDIFYGMGWESRSLNGVPVVRHDGTNANFYADMLLDPQDRWGVVTRPTSTRSTSTAAGCRV